jgi:hypothetical protein
LGHVFEHQNQNAHGAARERYEACERDYVGKQGGPHGQLSQVSKRKGFNTSTGGLLR